MSIAHDVEYLAICPAVDSDGLGVGLITIRSKHGCLSPMVLALHRAALERLRDDINSLLESGCVLNSQQTRDQAMLEKVIVEPQTLERFGFDDFEYVGGKDEP